MKVFGYLVLMIAVLTAGMYFLTPNKSNKSDTISPTILNQSPTTMPSTKFDKLLIEDVAEGTGAAVKSGDTVVIHYLGKLTDGTKFDSSYDRGAPFETQIGAGRVIKGWDLGIVGLKIGGRRILKIPAELGYGLRGAPPVIPPNADLVFEVELVDIKK